MANDRQNMSKLPRGKLAPSVFERTSTRNMPWTDACGVARQLAEEVLSAEQIAAWNESPGGWRRSFPVRGSGGGRFDVVDGWDSNIRSAIGGIYCVVVRDQTTGGVVPPWDLFVAQKLLLENDEPLFWRIAR